ncbi:SAM-dependent methyltransferase [Gordonia sp. DT219]|uniref:SAM-dependent methyltransferase n=1 Tax=Gordonia sp. DT219 TaxID=3416658 RepID=UPI003CE6DE92
MTDLDALGRTALGVAYLRARESGRADALFQDPLASALFSAAEGEDVASTPTADSGTGDSGPGDSGTGDRARRGMYHWIVARTLFFDELCRRAAADGVRQFVILGSGLDARAFRLDLGTDSLVVELDRPAVIDVKESLVAEHGLAPTGTRRVVAADLTAEWWPALSSAGVTTDAPICWLAEGLLAYLAPEAVWRVIDTIGSASVSGSRLGATVRSGRARPARDPYADVAKLWHPDPGIVERLTGTGWTCERTDAAAVLAAYGRDVCAPRTGATIASRTGSNLLAARYGSVSVGVAD